MNVLIVEDDPMVEFIHRNYLEKVEHFENIYSVNTIEDALKFLSEKNEVDLLLLDINLTDGNGLDFLANLRDKKYPLEVILITAADELESVKLGLHLGVIDYLIKPFTYNRFVESISLFLNQHEALKVENLKQADIDQIFLSEISNVSDSKPKNQIVELDKGLSHESLEIIKQSINSFDDTFTVQELTDYCGLSHVSVRKYLNYLKEHHYIDDKSIYTKVGRPYKVFYKI